MISAAPYLILVGNHESDNPNGAHGSYFNVTDAKGECGVMTLALLPMPKPATVDGAWGLCQLSAVTDIFDAFAAPWTSMNVGLVHIVGLSTEHDFTNGSAQVVSSL